MGDVAGGIGADINLLDHGASQGNRNPVVAPQHFNTGGLSVNNVPNNQRVLLPAPSNNPATSSWNTAPDINNPVLGTPKHGINVGHFVGSGVVENALNAPEVIARAVQQKRAGDISGEQAVGQVSNALLNSAGLALPVGRGASVAFRGGKLLPKVVAGTKVGAGFGAASGASQALAGGGSPGQVAKSTAIGTATGGLGGAVLPVAGVGAKGVGKATLKGAKAVRVYDQAQNQAGAVGKNVNKPKATLKQPVISEADLEEMRLGQMHQKAQTPNPVNISPELANLQNRYETPLEPNTMDQIMAQSTGMSKAQITNERDIALRKLEAEQMALNHLQNGGTRDEAASLFQKATGTTKKDALFQVQRVAKEGKQSLNVSPETPNPLLKTFELPKAKPGEFHVAPANRRAVLGSIDLAEKRATAFENQLHPEDKANLEDFGQGTKDINTAHNPGLVKQALDSVRTYYDTVHAIGQNYGNTKHIENFFPGYYERSPEQLAADRLQAEQSLESQYGSQVWNSMSADEKAKALEDYQPNFSHGEDVNYAGFHSKGKIYKTKQEAIAAGETPLFTNPFDALRRHATGAKLQLGDQAMIQAVRDAEPVQAGTLHTVDLPGGGFVRVGKEGIKVLKNEGVRKPPGLLRRGVQGVNKSIVRTIVANPVFHGGNQEFNAVFQAAWRLPGFKPANVIRLIKNQMSLKNLDEIRQEFYAQPDSFSPTYGSKDYGFIAKGLQKVGIDPKHAEISPRAMAGIEDNIRLALYKTARDQKMAPEAAIKTINKTLGGPDLLGDMASSYGLFLHYFKTNAKLLGDIGVQAAHGNLMPLTGLAVGYAAWTAANKAWQTATGNPDASVRAPGVLGTALQLAKTPGQVKRGQVPSVVTSHTNPLFTTGIEQVTNRDLHKPVVGPQSRDNNLDGNRLTATLRNTVGPGLTVQNVAGSKTSVPEALTGYATGLYTPHAKGYQAAPNIPFLNKSGAKAGTGLDEQKKFFAAQDKATKLVYGDNRAQAAYDNYLKRDKTSDGKTILLNPEEALSAAAGLSANPKALQAVQALKQGNSNHDPMWDLPTKDLKVFLDYQSTRKTDPELGVKKDLVTFSNGQKLTDFVTQRSQYYQDNQDAFKGSGAGTVPAPGTPEYPKVTASTQNLLDEYDKIDDPGLKAQFIADHPTVGQAFSDIFEYNNKLGTAQGGQALKAYPSMPPDVQKAYSFYLSLPQHDGPRGGSKTRSIWIQNHPNEWAAITDALANSALYEVGKEGAKNAYQGESPTQALLRNIYNLGQYDIGKSTDNRGNTTYGVGADAVAKAKSSSSGRSSRPSKEVKTYLPHNSYKFGTDRLVVKTKKGKLGRPKATLAKASLKDKPKVTIKKSRV